MREKLIKIYAFKMKEKYAFFFCKFYTVIVQMIRAVYNHVTLVKLNLK